jgi:hypothetical protein
MSDESINDETEDQEQDENETGPWGEIRLIADEIGFDGDMTHGEWGRVFADSLMQSGSDDAIWIAVADFGAMYRSKHYTDQRGRIREMTRQVARGTFKSVGMAQPNGLTPSLPVSLKDDGSAFVAKQLAYPITLHGEPPRTLADSNFWILEACGDYYEKKMRGLGQNLERVRRWAGIVKPWPDRTVSALLHDKTITATELFPPDLPPAIADGAD